MPWHEKTPDLPINRTELFFTREASPQNVSDLLIPSEILKPIQGCGTLIHSYPLGARIIMATFEQERERREKLQQILGELNKIKPEALVRKDVLGKDLSFEAGLPVFQRTLELYKSRSECNLDDVPYETLGQLTSIAEQAFQYFEQITTFSIQQHPSNPAQVRDQLINQLRDAWHGYYTNITPQIAYAIRRGSDFDSLEREARGSLA